MDEKYFAQFKHESLRQLNNLKTDDVEVFVDSAIPKVYTVVARPDRKSLAQIKKFQSQLRAIDSDQYFYPELNLHLTLIGNLPITIDEATLIHSVQKVLSTNRLRFELSGIGSNERCCSMTAYPIGFSLHHFRKQLRLAVGAHGDNFSSILHSYEYVGWINCLRYLQKPTDELFERLRSLADASFGELLPAVVQIYRTTSKILVPKKSELIRSFKLDEVGFILK